MKAPGADWAERFRRPIAASLLLSAALHLCLILLVQSRPLHSDHQTLVISARLLNVPAPMPPKAAATTPPPTTAAAHLSTPDMLATPQASAPVVQAAPSPITAEKTAESPPSIPAISPARPEPVTTAPSLALGIDTTWYQARQVDVQPKAASKIVPLYPEEARQKGLEGTLKLRMKIDDLGRVREAEVVEADPPGVFEQATLAAFREARFQPAIRDGRPVRIEAYFRVDFKLER